MVNVTKYDLSSDCVKCAKVVKLKTKSILYDNMSDSVIYIYILRNVTVSETAAYEKNDVSSLSEQDKFIYMMQINIKDSPMYVENNWNKRKLNIKCLLISRYLETDDDFHHVVLLFIFPVLVFVHFFKVIRKPNKAKRCFGPLAQAQSHQRHQ